MPVKNNPKGKSSKRGQEENFQPEPFDPEKDATITELKPKVVVSDADIQSQLNPEGEQPNEEMPIKGSSKEVPEGHDPENALVVIEKPQYHPRLGHKLSRPQQVTVNNRDWVNSLKFWKDLDFVIREVTYLPEGWKEPDASIVVPE